MSQDLLYLLHFGEDFDEFEGFFGWLMWKYICFIFPDPLDLCSLFWSFKQSNLVFFCVIDYEWNSTLATSQQTHQNMAYPKLNKNLCAVMTNSMWVLKWRALKIGLE